MIEVSVRTDSQDRITDFEVDGHSTLADSGHDMLCASVSTLMEVLHQGLADLPNQSYETARAESTSEWQIHLRPSQMDDHTHNQYQYLFESVLKVINRLRNQHPDNISITGLTR